MGAQKVTVGFLRYIDVDGNGRIGFFGEEVEVHEDDLERFESLNVVSEPESSDAESEQSGLSQDDVDAAVQTAVDEKDAELAEARKVVEAKAAELAQQAKDLDAAKAEFEKQQAAAKAAPAKSTAAKQS